MADTDDMNLIRVGVLGVSVDQSTTWTTAPPAFANVLNTPDRIINRVLNTFNTRLTTVQTTTSGFADRFDRVIGDENAADQAAFDSLGMNLIQTVAAGGGGASFEFEQTTPDTEWTITHGLNRRLVAVQIIDDSGNTVIGDIDYDTINRCILTFSKAIAGTAIIRR